MGFFVSPIPPQPGATVRNAAEPALKTISETGPSTAKKHRPETPLPRHACCRPPGSSRLPIRRFVCTIDRHESDFFPEVALRRILNFQRCARLRVGNPIESNAGRPLRFG